MNALLLHAALKRIPTHREPARRPALLRDDLAAAAGIERGHAEQSLAAALSVLRELGLLREHDGDVALGGPTETLFRDSLLWYLENRPELATRWNRLDPMHFRDHFRG